MALAQRINGNNSASMGNTSGKLSQKDIIPIQPVSQSTAADDNKAQIMQITATPYATCSTASATATKQATMQNFPSDYSPVVGSKIKVKFTNANTAATQMYLKVGTLAAKPCTCRGIAMGAGSVLAGSKIEFMYDGEAWDCQLCEAISSMDITSKSPINSTALNGALANYQSIEVLGGGTYTISELVTLLLGKTETQKTKKFIIKNEYNNGIVISNFLGGTTSYRFIVGDITCSKYSNNQYSLIFNINTYYIDSNRYFANLLVEYSCTNTGQEKWTKYTTDTDLNGALENYNKTFYGYSGSKYNLVISLNRLNHLGLMLKTENNNGSGSIYYITQNQNYKICGEDLTITKDTTANTITVRLVTNYCYCLIENITQNGTVENRNLINSFTFS